MGVRITLDELECLSANSLALEHLDLIDCLGADWLVAFEHNQALMQLVVIGFVEKQGIENKTLSLSNFTLNGHFSQLSLGEASQMMVLDLHRASIVYYARAKLPSIMPNLETPFLHTNAKVDTPMLPTKFLNLNHLTIRIWTYSYDYFLWFLSWMHLLPCILFPGSGCLQVALEDMDHESIFEGSLRLRQLPEIHHHHLKSVEIIESSSTKSLVQLTSCIVKSAVSLERLTLDTLRGDVSCSE
ncbi:hypothetical protein HU200_028384 [Digitaria exilis]|uniref:At1g61320/AtMIF1 LRR domain-containing protein n=1 Tax=Digitaria exilis TaxID=1010633 RepID=A0A835EPU1_9POAL|nr:hypothetical protein HU200_028384 [Digitaria exilis]